MKQEPILLASRHQGKTALAIRRIDVAIALADVGYEVLWARQAGEYNITKTLEGVEVTLQDISSGKRWHTSAHTVAEAVEKLSKLQQSVDLLRTSGRVYNIGAGRKAVHLWSKNRQQLRDVVDSFGGNEYRHGSGYIWICSNRNVLAEIARQTECKDRMEELDDFLHQP